METLKINRLEIENVKRVKSVRIEPTANGLIKSSCNATAGQPNWRN